MNISSKENQINEEIREKEVRVIDTDGSQLGIMPTSQALNIAAEKKLDLVNIAPSQNRRSVRYSTTENTDTSFRKKKKKPEKNRRSLRSKKFVSARLSKVTIFRSRPRMPLNSSETATRSR